MVVIDHSLLKFALVEFVLLLLGTSRHYLVRENGCIGIFGLE